jgi:hypothetical protein
MMERIEMTVPQEQHHHATAGGCAIEYYTLQPAPTQWVAVGRRADPVWTPSLMVGTGKTEDDAVTSLRNRCPHGHPETRVMVRLAPGERFD